MSVRIEVNPNTVMRTYSYLQDMGIIFNKRGIGHFVAENAYYKTLELKRNNFIKRELPHVFRTMDLLNMDFDDLKNLYRKEL
jgi:DNA-binding transcriptional regulator YhcF (GntR family)